jgi:hypothetical protein
MVGAPLAACARERFVLSDEFDGRPAGDPELTLVLFMCVGASALPGPYGDHEARRHARAPLIPGELLERRALYVHQAAAALCIPADELEAAWLEPPTGTRPAPVLRGNDGSYLRSCVEVAWLASPRRPR